MCLGSSNDVSSDLGFHMHKMRIATYKIVLQDLLIWVNISKVAGTILGKGSYLINACAFSPCWTICSVKNRFMFSVPPVASHSTLQGSTYGS